MPPLLCLQPPPGQPLNTHTPDLWPPAPPSLKPSYSHRGLPWMSGQLKIRNQKSLYPHIYGSSNCWRHLGRLSSFYAQPTLSQLTSCHITAKSSLSHCTHTNTSTHTLPLRPHCSVRPPASEMTIAIVAVYEEAAPHHHRLIIICCFNDSWWLYHSRYTSVMNPVLILIRNQIYFLSQKSLLDCKVVIISSEYFGN